jgi:hypothetical protein
VKALEYTSIKGESVDDLKIWRNPPGNDKNEKNITD